MFFTFIQNNSGGRFDIDHDVSKYVIIEADSADEANQIAEDRAGIYFDGCESGADCDCCGDRWYRQWGADEGTAQPEIYGQPAEQGRIGIIDRDTAVKNGYCHIYYLDGLKRTLYPSRGEQQLIEG